MAFSKFSSLNGRRRAATRPAAEPERQTSSSSGAGHYDPHQPRVPAGQRDGGQWTKLGALSNAAFRPSPTADDLPPTSRVATAAPDGERRSPRPIDGVQLARTQSESNTGWLPFPLISVPLLRREILQKYDDLSARANPGQRVILEFKAWHFERDQRKQFDFAGVRLLDREEVERYCPKIKEVQGLTDRAYEDVINELRKAGRTLNPADFGTAVHSNLNARIREPKSDDDIRDARDLISEKSFLKGKLEVENNEYYGKADSIRVDVIEPEHFNPKQGWSTCIDDIKTGKGRRSGLSWGRILEMLHEAKQAYPNADHIIINQIRPSALQNQ